MNKYVLQKNEVKSRIKKNGREYADRTRDQRIKSPVLYQLS